MGAKEAARQKTVPAKQDSSDDESSSGSGSSDSEEVVTNIVTKTEVAESESSYSGSGSEDEGGVVTTTTTQVVTKSGAGSGSGSDSDSEDEGASGSSEEETSTRKQVVSKKVVSESGSSEDESSWDHEHQSHHEEIHKRKAEMGDKFHKSADHFAGVFGLNMGNTKRPGDDQAKRDREAAERAAKEKAARDSAEVERLKKLEEERRRKAEADRTRDLKASVEKAAQEAAEKAARDEAAAREEDQDLCLSVMCSAPFWDANVKMGGPPVYTRTKTDVILSGTREVALNAEPQPAIGATYVLPPPQIPQPPQFPQPSEHVQSRELGSETPVGATYVLPPNMQTTRPMMLPSDPIMTRSTMPHSDAIPGNNQRTRNIGFPTSPSQAGRVVDTNHGQVIGRQAQHCGIAPEVNSVSRSIDNVRTESFIVRSSGATFPGNRGRNMHNMTVMEDTGSISTQRSFMEAAGHSNRMISAHASGYGPLRLQRLNCNAYGGRVSSGLDSVAFQRIGAT